MELQRLLPGFQQALSDEIAAARRQGGDRVFVSGGRYLGPSHQGFLYEFRLESETYVPDDCGIELEIARTRYTGTVVCLEGFDITLELEEQLPTVPNRAVLVVKLWYILERLRGRLEVLAEDTRLRGALDFLRAAGPNRPEEVRMFRPRSANGLNANQSAAVQQSLANPATFIWGPPGTGKTTTVGHLVHQASLMGLRSLIAAYSNAAVDVAMLAVAGRYTGTARSLAGKALRLGTPRKREVLDHPWLSVEAVARLIRPELVTMRDELRAQLDTARLRRDTKAVDRIRSEIRFIRDELRALELELAREARVLGCTLAKLAVNPFFEAYRADVVVLDEASMASMPFAALASAVTDRNFVLAGDFRQLPPVVLAQTPAAEEWLETHIFDFAGITGAVRSGGEDPRLIMLSEQYRMHPQISAAVSTLFYAGQLRDGEDTTERTEAIAARPPVRQAAIVIADTSDLRPRCVQEPKEFGQSRFNLVHALANLALLSMAVESHDSVAVITPFRAQAKLLRLMVEDLGWSERVQVSTVHRFQGGEADCVLLDLCSAEPHRPLGPLLSGDEWSLSARLLNVAISRARGKLIVVADTKHLQREGRDLMIGRVLGELVARAKGSKLQYGDLAGALGRSKVRQLVSIENGHLYGGSVVQPSTLASELALNVATSIPAPEWVKRAGERGGRVLISGTNLHASWGEISNSRLIRYQRMENVCLVDRSDLWIEMPGNHWTAHLRLRETAKNLGSLLRVIPPEEAGQVLHDPEAMGQRGPLGVRCPQCGGPMWLEEGRFGPFLRCLDATCRSTKSLTVESATELMKTMNVKCSHCGALPVVRKGNGLYMRCSRDGCDWRANVRDFI